MKGMILAAGVGSRLRPITEKLPKALIEVGGRRLIDFSVDTMAASGITDIVINLHHHGAMIRDYLGDGRSRGVNFAFSTETELLGSGGGIVAARGLIAEDDFVTLNADTLIDIDLRKVMRFHQQQKAVATMVLRKDPAMESYGIIRTDVDGRVVQFLETPARDRGEGPSEAYMYTGAQVLSPRVFDYMPRSGGFSITQVTYPRMLEAGETVVGYRFEGRWITVGTHQELAEAERLLG